MQFFIQFLIVSFLVILSVAPTVAVIYMLYKIFVNTQPPVGPNLEPCPDCGSAVSKSALFCPHCGRPSTSSPQNRVPSAT